MLHLGQRTKIVFLHFGQTKSCSILPHFEHFAFICVLHDLQTNSFGFIIFLHLGQFILLLDLIHLIDFQVIDIKLFYLYV